MSILTSAPRQTLSGRPAGPEHHRWRPSPWVVLTAVFGGLILPGAGAPISDSDVWWHVRLGQWILQHGVPHHETWAFTALGRTWVPTSWAADVVLGLVHSAGGYRAIQIYQVVVAAVLLIALGVVLFKVGHSAVAFFVFALTAASLAQFMNGRPQAVALLFMLWLGCQARAILNGRIPRLWVIVIVTYLWANIHGSWALAPVAITCASLLAALDGTVTPRRSAQTVVAAALGGLSAAATPVGWRLVYWPLKVHAAAHGVSEWQRLQPLSIDGIFLTALVLFVILTWTARRRSFRTAELVWTIGCALLAYSAVRNVAPAALLLAPVAAQALTRSWSSSLRRLPATTAPAWVALLALLLGPARLAYTMTTHPATSVSQPTAIVHALKAMPEKRVRVLDDYNIGGYLTGMGAPKISVAIDGRTDNYAPAFVDRYINATFNLVGWHQLVEQLRPDAAVLWHSSALVEQLRQSMHWRSITKDHGWVLLVPPARS